MAKCLRASLYPQGSLDLSIMIVTIDAQAPCVITSVCLPAQVGAKQKLLQ